MTLPPPYFQTPDGAVVLYCGDCRDVLRGLPDGSVDSVVTDPPYGLSFMGKKWDYDVPGEDVWRECLRVLKPGGHLLAFAGTRTQHRMAVRIEDAGFEIRDMIAWVYGSGFPKSLDVSKAIDKAAGAEQEVVGRSRRDAGSNNEHAFTTCRPIEFDITAPATDSALQWQGWGTALKPALEPITVARKPLAGTVAANVLQHGTGALNIDGCRVGTEQVTSHKGLGQNARLNDDGWKGVGQKPSPTVSIGRWPANLIHDGSEEVTGLLDSAARFFYCPKASKRDRDAGCGGLGKKQYSHDGRETSIENPYQRNQSVAANNHPTVKPTDLMRYLCRLVTPPGGLVLDPFAGSGSTGKGAKAEGFRFLGIELSEEYCEIAAGRLGNMAPAKDDEPLLAMMQAKN